MVGLLLSATLTMVVAAFLSMMLAAANSLGKRPWWVPKTRSDLPRASGEQAGIIINAQLLHGAAKLREILFVDLAAQTCGLFQ